MFEGLSIAIIIIILIALFYDFINGWNDAANSVATIIGTRVLTPVKAVALAALMNFVAFFIFSVLMESAVAKTVGKGLVDVSIVTPELILAGLIPSIFWGIVMTNFGIPISMSHTLIGGFIGAGIAVGGFEVLILNGIMGVFLFLALAPILGLIFAHIFALFLFRLVRKFRPSTINRIFGKLQLISASFYSITHGGNDALKTAGIIYALLISVDYVSNGDSIPHWVVLSAYAAISLGTLIGGWRVIKTMGMRLTKLKPVDGFCAETGGGVTLLFTGIAGIPASTTHVIGGSIIGVGAIKRLSAVRWGIARNIIISWIITIPITASGGFLMYKLLLYAGVSI